MIFCKSSGGILDNDIWESVVMRKLLMASLKQVNLRIFFSCIVWMTIWATNFVLQMLERVVMLQLLQVTVSLSSCALLMVMLHTMQEAVRLIWTPMQRPSMVLSFISGVVRLMFCKSSISWGSVASLVFQYLTSSKMPSFNCLKWYVFPAWILSIMPSHKTSFTKLVSSAIRQSLLYFAFSPSFIMTCLFSAFLRTLALTSTVSYRSFPSAWVIVHIAGC